MGLIAAMGRDRERLMRWSEVAREAGHDGMILPPGAQLGAQLAPIDICLFDLGRQAGAALQPLLDAVSTCPDTHFVALSACPGPQEGLQLLRAGVRGYGNRLASRQVLLAMLSAVGAGEVWAGRQVTDYLLAATLARAPAAAPPEGALRAQLTTREVDIAEQVAAGLSNKVIAGESGITERTVKAHLNSIFRKTGIRNRVQLALAFSQGEQAPPRRSHG